MNENEKRKLFSRARPHGRQRPMGLREPAVVTGR